MGDLKQLIQTSGPPRRYIANCKHCSGSFESYRSQGKIFCSPGCASAYAKQSHYKSKKRSCKICNAEFVPPHPKSPGIFCSHSCRAQNAKRFRPEYSCLKCGIQFTRAPSRKPRRFCSPHCYRSFRGESSLESQVRVFLDHTGIDYVSQEKIGKYTVDFYIPSFGTVIEVDGSYWHGLLRAKDSDPRKTQYLEAQGFQVVRLSERETGVIDMGDLSKDFSRH